MAFYSIHENIIMIFFVMMINLDYKAGFDELWCQNDLQPQVPTFSKMISVLEAMPNHDPLMKANNEVWKEFESFE